MPKGDDQYVLLSMPLPLMLWCCFVWTIAPIRSFLRALGYPEILSPTVVAPSIVAVSGGNNIVGKNIVAAESTEREFGAVVVVPDPSCFILLAGGGASRASSW
jgi:hypothetical protein